MGRTEFSFGGLSNSRHESKTPQGKAWAMQNATAHKGILQGGPRYSLFWDRSGATDTDAGHGFTYVKHSNNEIQKLRITGAPTGGTVRITVLGQLTATIAYNATAATVQNAIEVLAGINTGDIRCSGGPWPGQPIFVEFRGQYAGADQAIIVLTTNSLTGGSTPTLSISEFIKGGSVEKFLAVVSKSGASTCSLYGIDMDGTETEIVTGLDDSDHLFEQFGNQAFDVNAVDGLHYLRIGGSWDDTSGAARPAVPGNPPKNFTYSIFYTPLVFAAGGLNATITATNLNETVARHASGGFTLTNGTAITNTPTEIVISVAFAAQDYQFNDLWAINIRPSSTSLKIISGSVKFAQENNAAAAITPADEYTAPALSDGSFHVISHFGGVDRTTRDDIVKFLITLRVTDWPTSAALDIDVQKGWVAMANSVPVSATPGSIQKARMEYAYSSYNVATDVESPLSDPGITPVEVPQNLSGGGVWVGMALVGNPDLTTSDRLYVYRREKATGYWRRLPVDANNLTTFGAANVTSGSTSFVDKWMEHELQDFPLPTIPDFPGGTDTISGIVIGSRKRSLVIGSGKKSWESFVRQPQLFAPDPDNEAATKTFVQQNSDNADAGRTQYVSDNKAEEIVGIIGQDTLYAITPFATYASVGDTPNDSSPFRRMPGSRGAVGRRAHCRFGGGVEVASEDGLWYQSVGRGFSGEDNGALVYREETLEVRRSYVDTLLGSSYSGAVCVEHLDELWIFNGTKFLRRDREGGWYEGTFSDSVKAAVSVRSRGLYIFDSKGRIHKISEGYTTDNGTQANWSWETGILDGPPSKITGVQIECLGNPRITIYVFAEDGDKSYPGIGKYREHKFDTESHQMSFRTPFTLLPGTRYKMLFSGVCGTDEVHSVAFDVQPAGKDY